ncbi:carboxymuconolactone decarboxylase [Curtobacterium sp. BH-2-1-1]|uniref:carboxymuconolactone decarboxylase family protein n=1 Tax=Curtobacterium sp. BH-2-1-1 TaxID=1905847 RepID=UPI00089DFD91|nr:carboxymuconolactone decarboxylase family protein [Curtobacterium sp. BH-2-1-1]AOX65127.1 carboxymuconolactone decarboxylase [Curtobacterium sp. BH-2-1-1]
MPANPAAQREHAQLFPDHTSALAETDPGFAASFADFALDETLRDVAITRHDRLLVQLGATIAVGAHTEFAVLLEAALANEVTPVEAKEVVYQAVAYVGFARTVDFLTITDDALVARGVALPLPDQRTTDPETRLARGREVQGRIVGADRVDRMYDAASPDTVHFQRFLSGNCFGDTVARGGLGLRTRELVTFAMLVALGGADAQVRGHVAGNLAVGNHRRDLLDVLTVLVPFIGYPRTLNGLAVVDDAAPATDR